MDQFREEKVIQQSLLETDGDRHMDNVLEHLKRANPDSHNLVHVIVVDKDLNEIRLLESHFDDPKILICLFHVIKYLLGKVSLTSLSSGIFLKKIMHQLIT